MTTPSSTYYQSAQDLIIMLGGHPTSTGVNLFVAWQIEENGWHSSLPCKNPLNTTWRMPGSHNMNSVGVQCYPNWTTGLRATINTLEQGNPSYGTLANAVRTGNASEFFDGTGRQELLTWSGGSTHYANTIQSVFNGLPAVPSKYLTGGRTSTTSPSPAPIPTGTNGIALLSGLGLVGYGFYRKYRKRL